MHQIKVKNGTFVKFIATLYVKKFGIWWQKEKFESKSVHLVDEKIEEWIREHPGTEVIGKFK